MAVELGQCDHNLITSEPRLLHIDLHIEHRSTTSQRSRRGQIHNTSADSLVTSKLADLILDRSGAFNISIVL